MLYGLALTLNPAAHQFVARLGLIHDFARGLRPRDRQARWIKQADLNENGGLIPVDMLVDQLIAFEFDNGDGGHVHYASGRWHAGQEPVYLCGMSEVHNKLIYNAIYADGAANRRESEVGRIHPYKMILVKAFELIMPDASRHRGNMVHVGLRHHGCHSGIDITSLELIAAVRFPKRD